MSVSRTIDADCPYFEGCEALGTAFDCAGCTASTLFADYDPVDVEAEAWPV